MRTQCREWRYQQLSPPPPPTHTHLTHPTRGPLEIQLPEMVAFNWSHLWLARLGPEAAFHLGQGIWCLRLGLYCVSRGGVGGHPRRGRLTRRRHHRRNTQCCPALPPTAPPWQLVPLMPTSWLVLPVELLQGFTFAMACEWGKRAWVSRCGWKQVSNSCKQH